MGHSPARVLVTGASGHVGANLVRALRERGHHVRALVHRDSRGLADLGVEAVHGDIAHFESLTAAFQDIDVVYHCAARISIVRRRHSLVEQTNVAGTANVVRACLQGGVRRLIHFSSIHATRDQGLDNVIDETTRLALQADAAPYDRSKAQGEQLVMSAVEDGLDAVIVAPTAVVGPHDYRPSHFGRVILALSRAQVPALINGGYDWVDVRDVVEGAVTAASRAPSGSKYMLSGHWASLADVAAYIARSRRCREPLMCLPSWVGAACAPASEAFYRLRGTEPLLTRFSVEALSRHKNVSHERASRDLGYEPRPLGDTIADTVRWFEHNGNLSPCEGAG